MGWFVVRSKENSVPNLFLDVVVGIAVDVDAVTVAVALVVAADGKSDDCLPPPNGSNLEFLSVDDATVSDVVRPLVDGSLVEVVVTVVLCLVVSKLVVVDLAVLDKVEEDLDETEVGFSLVLELKTACDFVMCGM